MLRRLRSRATYANVASTLALFLAVSTGGAYAVNTIGSADIIDESIKSADIKNGEVKLQDVGSGSVNSSRIVNESIESEDIKNAQVKVGDLGTGSVSSAKILNETIESGDIKDGEVTSPDLADGAVTSAKVLDDTQGGGLTAADIQTNAIGQDEIATDGVGAVEIANDSIDSGEIIDFGLSNQDVGVLFAEVNANGTLANSSGNVIALKLGNAGTGNYEVDFGRNITQCTAVATIGPSGAGSALGEVNVADRAGGNVEAVFVDTNTSAGAAADLPFRLVVVC